MSQKQIDLNKKLIKAAKKEDLEKVKLLLDDGADFRFVYKHHLNAVYCAAEKRNKNILKLFFERGLEANFLVNWRSTLLGYFLSPFDQEMVDFLFEKGYDVNLVNNNSRKSPALVAIKQGNLEVLKFLIDKNIDLSNVATRYSYQNKEKYVVNALDFALQTGQTKTAEYLMENYPHFIQDVQLSGLKISMCKFILKKIQPKMPLSKLKRIDFDKGINQLLKEHSLKNLNLV